VPLESALTGRTSLDPARSRARHSLSGRLAGVLVPQGLSPHTGVKNPDRTPRDLRGHRWRRCRRCRRQACAMFRPATTATRQCRRPSTRRHRPARRQCVTPTLFQSSLPPVDHGGVSSFIPIISCLTAFRELSDVIVPSSADWPSVRFELRPVVRLRWPGELPAGCSQKGIGGRLDAFSEA
jgi:hypothetical protein